MTNRGKARRANEAEAPGRGAIEASRSTPGALPEEMIRARAYQLYRERDGRAGDAIGDWLAAEREHREAIAARVQPTPQGVGHGRMQ